ncbi:MAG: hypothetical protein FD173_1927 [Gallionellaceae bacterium]|nr:MAG: hypothetical protein FD173_1927 [Gallionellaceae bacterium]
MNPDLRKHYVASGEESNPKRFNFVLMRRAKMTNSRSQYFKWVDDSQFAVNDLTVLHVFTVESLTH